VVYHRVSDREAEKKLAALRIDYMTIQEAIEFIVRIDSESATEIKQDAFKQILDAMEDGELKARWLDQNHPRGYAGGALASPDEPIAYLIRKKKFRLKNGGKVFYSLLKGSDGSHWRTLLLSRKDMERIFKPSASPAATFRQLTYNVEGKRLIHEAITAVYKLADEQGVKPPNINEMRTLAQTWLEKYKDAQAKGAWIERLSKDPCYKSRRGKPGATRGRLRKVSELEI
jgi:hypothetical protein